MVLRQPMERLILQAGTLPALMTVAGQLHSQVAEVQAPTGTLVEQDQPAIKVIRRYEAKYIHSVEADKSLDMTEQQESDIDAENVAAEDQKTGSIHRDIYDLGQNISGMRSLM